MVSPFYYCIERMRKMKTGIINANIMKWIAIITMTIDHIAWAFVPTDSYPAICMHTVGKITGPLMFFFIAEGYHHTGNLKKYLLRLLGFAMISQIPYSMFVNQGKLLPFAGNVIFTLLLSLIAVIVYEKSDHKIIKWFIIITIVAVTYWFDWCFFGVLFTVCFHIFYGDMKKQAICYLILNAIKVMVTYLQYAGSIYYLLPALISPFLVLILLYLYNGKRGGGKISKYAFYIFYPAHLIVIYLISSLIC